MATAKEIIKLAQKYIGVKESPANSNKCIFTKKYGVIGPWCVSFEWCIFDEAKASALFYAGKKTNSCGTLMRWAKSKGQWITSGYKPGDLVMFNFSKGTAPEHTGICVKWDGKTMVTVDGNTGSTNEANGGMVMQRERNIKYVVGAVRPKYEAEKETTPVRDKEKPVTVTLTQIYKGSKGELVKLLQRQLNAAGYKDGADKVLVVDGSFGGATDYAVKAYQKANGLDADGYVGSKTWTAVLTLKGAK